MPIEKLIDGRRIDTDKLPSGYKVRYGRLFNPGVTRLMIEFSAFRENWPEAGGSAKAYRRIEETLWPGFLQNEWSDRQTECLCRYDLVAFMGCGGSGKSQKFANYALIRYWAAPQDTAIAITSESIDGARRRVWGHLTTAFREARFVDDDGNPAPRPGTLTDQPAAVRLTEKTDGVRGGMHEAILLVAAGNDARESALETLQGLHNVFVILILDELQSLTPSIIGPVLGNLKNNVRFQLLAAGNIGDASDPLGTLCRPVTPDNRGYDDVGPETECWEIERLGIKGICVRFDATKSPNLAYHARGEDEPFPCLPTYERVEGAKLLHDEGKMDSATYYKQFRAFIVPTGVSDNRWSANAILRFHGSDAAKWASAGGFVLGCGCDPAYTSGGDRFILKPGRYGQLDNGLYGIEFLDAQSLQHNTAIDELRSYAMVSQSRDWCKKEGIEPTLFGVDISGDNPIGDLFAKEWSIDILRVNFMGKATQRPISQTDRRPCIDEYGNMATELWCVGAEFLRHDQLRGISEVQQKELITRKVERGAANKLFAEAKRKMKVRTGGVSPDEADGGNILIEVFRQRLGAVPGSEGVKQIKDAWSQQAKKTNVNPVRLVTHRGIQSMRRFR